MTLPTPQIYAHLVEHGTLTWPHRVSAPGIDTSPPPPAAPTGAES